MVLRKIEYGMMDYFCYLDKSKYLSNHKIIKIIGE